MVSFLKFQKANREVNTASKENSMLEAEHSSNFQPISQTELCSRSKEERGQEGHEEVEDS